MKILKIIITFFVAFLMFGEAYSQSKEKETFVIVHGAFGGRHNFKGVDSILTSKSNIVYRPCLTGLGERVHLSSPEIGLKTHILDVVNTILYEDIKNVVLVGHSYGGMVVSGVVDSIPERIKKLVYLDATVPNDGENSFSIYGEEGLKEANEYYKKYLKNGLIFLDSENFKRKNPPKDEGQPYKTFTDTISLKNKLAEKIPTYFIDCGSEIFAKRAKDKGWPVYKLGNEHNVQWSEPEGLVELLIKIADAKK